MFQILLLLLVFMCTEVFATETTVVLGTETVTNIETTDVGTTETTVVLGTITIEATETTPFVVRAEIVSEKEVIAGVSIAVKMVLQFSDGKSEELDSSALVGFISSEGTINTEGIFSCEKAGKVKITGIYGQFQATAEITVLPAEPIKADVIIGQIPFGERIKIAEFLNVVGIDRFGNRVNSIPYLFEAKTKETTFLSRKMSNFTLPDGRQFDPSILTGGILTDGQSMIFFDFGEYTGTVTLLNGVKSAISFTPSGVKKFPVKDEIINIDIATNKYEVKYVIGDKEVRKTLYLPNDWITKFMQFNVIDCVEVICWVQMAIEREKEKIYMDYQKEVVQNIILKPFLKKE